MTDRSDAATVEIVAAFTKDGGAGNLAGVVLDAAGNEPEERQRIAARVALSETVFVTDTGGGTFETFFNTPTKPVPDCGHATVAAFGLLAQRGRLRDARATKRTIAGDRAITIDGMTVFMEQPLPSFAPFGRRAEIAAALGLDASAIVSEPVLADNGVRFVLVPTTRDTLAAAAPDDEAIVTLTADPDVIALYVYARDAHDADATIRMFGPNYGIPEEPATGMAAGMLGAYLARDGAQSAFRFEQGALSPRPSPSELLVHAQAGAIRVGGAAQTVRTIRVAP